MIKDNTGVSPLMKKIYTQATLGSGIVHALVLSIE
jgi:hypothetical protein